MTPEGKVVAHLVKRVEELNGLQRKVSWEGRKGAPDRLVLLPGGVSGFFELKRPGGNLSKIQEVEIKRLRDMGVHVYVCDSCESVDRALEDLQWQHASRQGSTND